MNKKLFILLFALLISFFGNSFTGNKPQQKDKNKDKPTKNSETKEKVKEKEKMAVLTAKLDTATVKLKNILPKLDSLDLLNSKLKVIKKNAHASYYHNKFNGRRTASGSKFNNDAYTAAHKKLPFGTKLKVTNEANGKFVIVEVTDRGPFSKAREIDLSRRAFMDIADNKNSGVVFVTVEVIEPK
ncbi:septal ring lytic transglycosylase RlpA family protein [Flavobacterium sp.]|uniref:septal ring lytic transglycosylase RlpA family protein n=1 Tax=Flavobacterium sp. TaxID=239 RepID=UPI002487DE9C|nr:septal ring lytic transglycosylase RlpA family protein [Flavobacterium sp.]MDI1316774.1 septal ring lytic transglycosylase RlpA family protein [Flavobacterium sp.]